MTRSSAARTPHTPGRRLQSPAPRRPRATTASYAKFEPNTQGRAPQRGLHRRQDGVCKACSEAGNATTTASYGATPPPLPRPARRLQRCNADHRKPYNRDAGNHSDAATRRRRQHTCNVEQALARDDQPGTPTSTPAIDCTHFVRGGVLEYNNRYMYDHVYTAIAYYHVILLYHIVT